MLRWPWVAFLAFLQFLGVGYLEREPCCLWCQCLNSGERVVHLAPHLDAGLGPQRRCVERRCDPEYWWGCSQDARGDMHRIELQGRRLLLSQESGPDTASSFPPLHTLLPPIAGHRSGGTCRCQPRILLGALASSGALFAVFPTWRGLFHFESNLGPWILVRQPRGFQIHSARIYSSTIWAS